MKLRCNIHDVMPVPWLFVVSRFHCIPEINVVGSEYDMKNYGNRGEHLRLIPIKSVSSKTFLKICTTKPPSCYPSVTSFVQKFILAQHYPDVIRPIIFLLLDS